MKPKTKEEFNEFTTALVTLIQKHEVTTTARYHTVLHVSCTIGRGGD
jgi:hypothetical protein